MNVPVVITAIILPHCQRSAHAHAPLHSTYLAEGLRREADVLERFVLAERRNKVRHADADVFVHRDHAAQLSALVL